MPGEDLPDCPTDIRIADRHGVVYVLDSTLQRVADEDGTRCWTVTIPGHVELPGNPRILIGVLPRLTSVRVIIAPRKDPFLGRLAER